MCLPPYNETLHEPPRFVRARNPNYPEKKYKFATTNDNIRVIDVVGYNKLVYIYFELKDNRSLYGTHIYLKNINDEIIKTIIFEEET